ncbi:HAD-IB family hydrolase [Porphyromonas loveana]|uniref:HAD-IB family hydrolase n=3 Tax=Porphyromonas loveana TaxID=1884669 RepID=UPI0035A0F1B7
MSDRAIAIFDFDGTLTRTDTLLHFLRLSQPRARYLLLLPFYLTMWLCFKLRLASAESTKAAILSTVTKGKTTNEIDQLSLRFVPVINSLLRSEALDRLEWHRRQGHQLVLLTASLQSAVEAWGERMRFDLIIGTQAEVKGDQLTGRFEGKNCKGEEKVRRLSQALPHWQEVTSYGYGDSPSDRPLLDRCTHAYYRHFPTVKD